jgi:hypothetical protein
MHVCDETGDPSGTISKASVSVIQKETTVMKQGRPNSVARVYFELNYEYFIMEAGLGLAGSQLF